MSISLYNKYRPATFDEVAGQREILKTLKNALDNNMVSHAYLFTGPAGTGKTTTARLLAKALLCGDAPTSTPDAGAPACIEVANGTHSDVYELDAASRTGVENIREEIINRVAFSPTRGNYKVYVIDEVHMLSMAAFNALLKTLEEPPAHVVFVLCTTDPQKVPATILARCQRFDFKRLSNVDVEACLEGICIKEGFEYDEEALKMIAVFANGGMRDAITALEQVSINGNRSVKADVVERTFGRTDDVQLDELAMLVAARDVPACFNWVDKFFEAGIDVAGFTLTMFGYYRNLYVLALTSSPIGFEDISEDRLVKMLSIAQSYGNADRLARILLILADLEGQLKTPTDTRLSLETALLKIVRPTSDLTLESLNERLIALESGQATVNVPVLSGEAAAAIFAQAAAKSETASAAAPLEVAAASDVASVSTAASVSVSAPSTPSAPAKAAATSAPESSAPSADRSEYQRLFQRAIDLTTKQNKMIQHLLGGAIPHMGEDKNLLLIELPSKSSFNKDMLSKRDEYEILEKSVSEAFGRPMKLEMYLGSSGAEAPAQTPAPTPEPTPAPEASSAPTSDEKDSLDVAKELLINQFGSDIEIEEI